MERRRKLRFDEIKQQAEEYFKDKFGSAKEFLLGSRFFYEQGLYKKAAFLLHQACENAYIAIRLVHTLKNSKLHDLDKLSRKVRCYSGELMQAFPRNTNEERRLFKLIKAAYIEGRYNPMFEVTKEDVDALTPKVELLHAITERICKEKIEYYEKEAKKQEKII